MTRRLMWMGVGAVAGGGATVWVRRRLDRLSRRMRPAQIAGGVATLMDQGARTTAGRVRQSVDTGRRATRRREHELRRDLEGREHQAVAIGSLVGPSGTAPAVADGHRRSARDR